MGITAEDIVKMFKEDAKARRMLAELLVSEPEVRLALVSAVLREVATRSDLERLGDKLEDRVARLEGRMDGIEERMDRIEEGITRLEERVERLEERITGLENRVARLEDRVIRLEDRVARLEGRIERIEGVLSLFVKLFIAFNLPILLGVIGILLKMVFTP